MKRAGWCLVVGAVFAVSLAVGGPTHPSELAPLTVDSVFPRFTPEELAAAGYPDHFHVVTYPGYEVLVDEHGETYGPRSLSSGTLLMPREGLVIEPGSIRYRGVHLSHNPEYKPFQIMPMMEVLDQARRDVSALLHYDRPDTLHVVDTNDLDQYRQLTGHAFHRVYSYGNDATIIEPAYILFKRGLGAHAAYHLVTEWLLDGLSGDAELPVWLGDGLASYLAEEGTHFLNFLAMYRPNYTVIMDPARAETLLAGAPDPDDELDKRQFRTAGYAAFLMVWELVENRGGLGPVCELFARSGRGEAPDAVCRDLYGVDLAGLAARLDPTRRPEPVGDAVQSRSPQRPPGRQ